MKKFRCKSSAPIYIGDNQPNVVFIDYFFLQEMTYYLSKAEDGKHKYKVITPEGRTIKFGAAGYEDFTIHKDSERKERYIKRHKEKEDWNNLNTAGAWSRWLLWNKKTLAASIKDIINNFKIKISTNVK